MEDWIVRLLPDAPWPVAIILGLVLLFSRGIGFIFTIFRPAMANDIKEIKGIVTHLDTCVDEVKAEVGHVKERVAFIEGTIERRKP